MKIEYKRADGMYKFIFTAKRSMTKDWANGWQEYETVKEEDPERFKIIEVQTDVQRVAEQMYARFSEKAEMSQKDVIRYLKNFCELFQDDYLVQWHGESIHKRTHATDTSEYFPYPIFTELYTWKSTYEIHKKR